MWQSIGEDGEASPGSYSAYTVVMYAPNMPVVGAGTGCIVNPRCMRCGVTVVVLCMCKCLSVCYQASCCIPCLQVQSMVL